MKNLLLVILAFAALTACTAASTESRTKIAEAEEAFGESRYVRAQTICDSLVIGDGFGRLNVDELCRLSLLLMRLSENSAEEGANVAFAAKSLAAAYSRDSDSTAAIILQMPTEDRARIVILTALGESGQQRHDDSLFIHPDSIPDNEL